MQIVDDGAAAEIEEIFACAAIACSPSLPPANMGQGMLNRHPFSKLSASLWGLLTLSQFNEQGFVWVNTHAAPFCAGCALSFQRALSADTFGKVDGPTRCKGHFLPSRTTNDLSVPIEGKC